MRCWHQAKGVFAEAFELGGEKTEVQIALQEWKDVVPECVGSTQNSNKQPAECPQNPATSCRQHELSGITTSADVVMPVRKQQQQESQQECGQNDMVLQWLDDGQPSALRSEIK